MQNLVTRKTKTYILAISVVFSLFSTSSCSNKSSPLVPTEVIDQNAVSQKPTINFVTFNPKIDILFVIDNSGSMSSAQANLRQNIRLFANEISKNQILDYQIGVVTSDINDCSFNCLQGRVKVINRNTPNLQAELENNMVVGINGSYNEEFFSPVLAAIKNTYNDPNLRQFYRPDAFLATIFITDTEDQSRINEKDFLNQLIALKQDAKKVLGYGVIVRTEDYSRCTSEQENTGKILWYLENVVNFDATASNILSLCDPDFGAKLANFAIDITKRTSSAIKLARVPDVTTIKVTYGSQVIPNDLKNGWVYENSTNSIIISPDLVLTNQGPGVQLSIDFVPLF